MTEVHRVKVWKDKDHYLGEGNLVGSATMFEAYSSIYKVNTDEEVVDLLINNMKHFMAPMISDRIPTELWEIFRKEQLSHLHLNKTPKIILDTGETVYGCQIWWDDV